MKDVWFLVVVEEVGRTYRYWFRESVDSYDILSRVVERYVMGVIGEIMLVSLVQGPHW